jgi:hypothetical protein
MPPRLPIDVKITLPRFDFIYLWNSLKDWFQEGLGREEFL